MVCVQAVKGVAGAPISEQPATASGGLQGAGSAGGAGISRASPEHILTLSPGPEGMGEAGAGQSAGAGPVPGSGGGAAQGFGSGVGEGPGEGEGCLGGSPLHSMPLPAGTELPTCPVCLERLDEHVSGVVTTVSCYHSKLSPQ